MVNTLKGLLNLCALFIIDLNQNINEFLFSLILAFVILIAKFARGSQRERDRERALARAGGKGKTKDDGLTPEQRRERYIYS